MKKIIIITLMIFLSGCTSFYRPIRTDKDLTGLNLYLDKDGNQIKQSVQIIDNETKSMKVKTETTKLAVIAENLIKKEEISQKIKTHVENLEENVEKLMNDKSKRVDDLFFYGIILGSVMVAAAITIAIISYASGVPNLSGLALQIGLAGVGIAAVSGIGYYYFWLAITAIVIIAVILLICIIVKSIKDNKSLTEVIRTNEIYKTIKDNDEAKLVIKTLQSPSTSKTVRKIRQSDKLK